MTLKSKIEVYLENENNPTYEGFLDHSYSHLFWSNNRYGENKTYNIRREKCRELPPYESYKRTVKKLLLEKKIHSISK